MDQTLDIDEVQVLVHYSGGFDYHRILLHRISGGAWLTLTPDHEIVRHDLDRRSFFPEDIVDQVYAHDPISKAALMNFKRQAKVQASILGEGEVDDREAYAWVVAEIKSESFRR